MDNTRAMEIVSPVIADFHAVIEIAGERGLDRTAFYTVLADKISPRTYASILILLSRLDFIEVRDNRIYPRKQALFIHPLHSSYVIGPFPYVNDAVIFGNGCGLAYEVIEHHHIPSFATVIAPPPR